MQIVLITVLTICMFTDMCKMKIFNFITFPLIICGIIYRFVNGNYVFAILCLLIGILFLLVPQVGGGDKKLLLGILLCEGTYVTFNIIIIAHLLTVAAYYINEYFYVKMIIRDKKKLLKNKTVIPMGPAYTLASIAVLAGYGIPIFY